MDTLPLISVYAEGQGNCLVLQHPRLIASKIDSRHYTYVYPSIEVCVEAAIVKQGLRRSIPEEATVGLVGEKTFVQKGQQY